MMGIGKRGRGTTGTLALLAALAVIPAANADTKPVTVVELFTSQGCSSCPPANANLLRIKDRPGVLALSYSVTYWDGLGWKDTFGRPEYTDRQRVYEPPLGHRGPFTPQMVVNGKADVVGFDLRELEGLVAKHPPAAKAGIEIGADSVRIDAGEAPASGADIWLVRYDPKVVQVPVGRGENSGRTLPHGNVVHALTRIGTWDGKAATLSVTPAPEGQRTAVLVQVPNGGPILSAATN